MASVFKRKQSGCEPALYAKCDLGERNADGKVVWRMRRVPDEHQGSRPAARRWADAHEEQEKEKRNRGILEQQREPTCGELFEKWKKTLTNRSADDDRGRLAIHLVPTFASMKVGDVKVPTLLEWIAERRQVMKPDGKTRRWSDATLRHALNLLSRFYGWAVENEYASINPVRLLRQGSRPQQTPKRDVPWLNDNAIVRKLVAKLRPPVGVMFYLGNRSGLRLGEIAGLRLSDLAFLDEGVVRVRYTYDGTPLKEDKRGEGKMKWVPAPTDAEAVLAPLIARREAEGAGPEDLVFANPKRKTEEGRLLCYRKEYVEDRWDEAAIKVGLFRVENAGTEQERKVPTITFYQATRHSFVSRNLAGGAALDEVSAAVGHSSPLVTRRYYDHFVRKTFSPALRSGLGLGAKKAGKLVPLRPVKPSRRGANGGAGVDSERASR